MYFLEEDEKQKCIFKTKEKPEKVSDVALAFKPWCNTVVGLYSGLGISLWNKDLIDRLCHGKSMKFCPVQRRVSIVTPCFGLLVIINTYSVLIIDNRQKRVFCIQKKL